MKTKSRDIALYLGGVLVYLLTCGWMTWLNSAYNEALHLNAVYFWVYGGVFAVLSLFSSPDDARRPDRNRVVAVFGFLFLAALCLTLVYLCVADGLGFRWLLYTPLVWWLFPAAVFFLLHRLCKRGKYRAPEKSVSKRSRFASIGLLLLGFYGSLAAVTAIWLMVVQPVSVKTITPVGEAEGGRFIGRITGDQSETPLGIYFFADQDANRWYYYDVLTGAPVDYCDPLTPD